LAYSHRFTAFGLPHGSVLPRSKLFFGVTNRHSCL
jgi:hypothetical protein